MKKPKLIISQMIKNYKEKELNKGKYTIQNLFIAKIEKPAGSNNTPSIDFAICEHAPTFDSAFNAINTSRLPYNYVLANMTPFSVFMEDYMKNNDLTSTDKLSLKQICEIEQELNKIQEHNITLN